MSVSDVSSCPGLTGSRGELISVRVIVAPFALEDLLECLALLSFPINPELHHGVPTIVVFPAWDSCLPELESALLASGFDSSSLDTQAMLTAIAA
ncbi:MAG: hypothetical protein H7039_17615 [Bryobacteraceae bacterium]|nr:hypothetical protein [Bryobacteraceae bacterium]